MIALDVRFLHVGLGRKKPAGAVGGIGKVQLETYRHFLINKPFRYILLGSSRYSEKVLKSSLPNFSESEVIHLFEKNRIAQTLGDRIASFLCGNEDEINSQRLSKIPEIHLVHVHEQVWPVTTKAAYKTVVTMHSHLFSKASEDWQKDEYSISDAEKRFLEKLHSCDAVLGVSRSVCDYLIGNFHIPKEKVHVTYSGVNPEVFKPISSSNKNDIESIQRRFGIRNPYFCYAGSWKKVKNIPTLIRIYEEYRKNSPRKVQLVLIGNVPRFTIRETIEIRRLIKNSLYRSDILEVPYLPDKEVALLLNGADIFLYASFHEGFGLCVAEAMACGVPVVASTGATIYAESGLADELLKPCDIHGFVEKIFKIQHSDSFRDDLIKRQLNAIESFTWQKTAQSVIEAYSKVLKS